MESIVKYVMIGVLLFAIACGETETNDKTSTSEGGRTVESPGPVANPKGVGKIENVELTDPLNTVFIEDGRKIYDMKCSGCHKLTDQRVVGPGWAGLTNRRSPEWIMNMIMNVEVMLEQDSAARAMLEECLTRMPNQGVELKDARSIVEFARANDIEQVGEKDKAVIK